MTDPETCPHCAADLRGELIPEAERWHFGGRTHYARWLYQVDPDLDRVVGRRCPDCGGTWKLQERLANMGGSSDANSDARLLWGATGYDSGYQAGELAMRERAALVAQRHADYLKGVNETRRMTSVIVVRDAIRNLEPTND